MYDIKETVTTVQDLRDQEEQELEVTKQVTQANILRLIELQGEVETREFIKNLQF